MQATPHVPLHDVKVEGQWNRIMDEEAASFVPAQHSSKR